MDLNTKLDHNLKRTPKQGNVISMRFDATFFYERGVRFLQKNDLKRALQAFRKTVEYEPENPVNHFNLAGVLSEMGDFEASNEVLMHVLDAIDPDMAECQFYLANNYANLGQYDVAEEYVIKYLHAAPDGEYADDAEEMLTVLMDEFGGGKAYARWEAEQKQEEVELAKRDGRHLLEQGHFEAAVEWLENVLQRDHDNTAAKNNLSLAYYYTGQYDKAVELAESVLEQHVDNMHALCNLTVFTAQLGPKERMESCLAQLRKLFPLHYDQAMKLGTTLGIVGDHAGAMNVFSRLAKLVERPEPVLLHSFAAAAANAGHFQVAKKWWNTLSEDAEMARVAMYYLELLRQAEREGEQTLRVSYQYDLPLQVQFAEMKRRLEGAGYTAWRKDPLLRASLYWGLRHGSSDTRLAVIRTLSLIPDEDAERALRLFLKRQDVDSSLQAAALYVLKRTGVKATVSAYLNGALQTIDPQSLPKDILLSIDAKWRDVLTQSAKVLEDWDHDDRIVELKDLWLSFLEDSFVRNDVRMAKPSTWTAGLVYVVLKRSGVRVTQTELAQRFDISVASLRKAAARLQPFYGSYRKPER